MNDVIDNNQTNIPSIFDDHIIYSMTDTNGVITNVSQAFCDETGYDKSDAIGRTHSFLRAPGFPDETYAQLWETITHDKIWRGQIKNIRKDGDAYWSNSIIVPVFDNNSIKTGYLAIRQDITKEKKCEELSMIDELTGAYNRRKFNIEINNFLINYYRYNDGFSLVMIDIDFFKKFNDRYGHLVGDEVLKRVCKLMQSSVRQGDLFSRWGGEEFVLILAKIDKDKAENVCNKLLNKIRLGLHTFLLENFDIRIPLTCSMGVTSPTKADSSDSLISRADSALYRAKHAGRNRVEML